MNDFSTNPPRRTSPLLLNDYHGTQQRALRMNDAEYAEHVAKYPPPWETQDQPDINATPVPAPAPRTYSSYTKQPIPPALRWAVWERDDFTCQHCGTRQHLSVDHVVPESKGGPATLENCRTLCTSCNSKKGARHA